MCFITFDGEVPIETIKMGDRWGNEQREYVNGWKLVWTYYKCPTWLSLKTSKCYFLCRRKISKRLELDYFLIKTFDRKPDRQRLPDFVSRFDQNFCIFFRNFRTPGACIIKHYGFIDYVAVVTGKISVICKKSVATKYWKSCIIKLLLLGNTESVLC